MKQSDQPVKGEEATRSFYDREGWAPAGTSSTVDYALFGDKESGPIRQELHQIRIERLRASLALAGPSPRVLECGCGGNPEPVLLERVGHYTGVDFSIRGLEVSRDRLRQLRIPHGLVQADIVQLPFPDESFDAVYSAHVLYHMSNPAAQAAAIREMVRVTRSGGVVLLVLANPRPLLFPARLVKRLIADTPGVAALANKLRKKPPLPYKPMTIGWTKRVLRGAGDLKMVGFKFQSTAFSRKVSESSPVGRRLWSGMRLLYKRLPHASARLGNYLLYTLVKA